MRNYSTIHRVRICVCTCFGFHVLIILAVKYPFENAKINTELLDETITITKRNHTENL